MSHTCNPHIHLRGTYVRVDDLEQTPNARSFVNRRFQDALKITVIRSVGAIDVKVLNMQKLIGS